MHASISEMKNQICWASKEIYQRGLFNIGEGNISLRVNNRDEMIITPSGNNYLNPLPENLVHVTFEGKIITEGQKPSTEYYLHRFFYEQRTRVNCIIHTHSTYASILAVQHRSLPIIFEEMLVFLGGGVSCSEYAATGTEELGVNALEAMGSQNAVILANHGLLIVGRNIEHCVFGSQLVEKMAKIYVKSVAMGKINEIPKGNVSRLLERFNQEFSTS
ncbi:MAG: class II aldolase/adducin family protein [Candidatus Heimdallarchaeota archaeon]|nr:class II aldolase/adducin family protein [Candidatus Heimdallarchaeota archaeon]